MRMEMEGPAPERPSPGLPVLDLRVYERHGGHTLRRHVDVTPVDLLRRVVSRESAGAGRFIDAATAQRCVETLVARHADEIRAWQRSPHRYAPFTVSEDMGEVIGQSLTWAAVQHGDARPRPVTGVFMLLRRKPELPGGYMVWTAYPRQYRRRTR